MRKLQLPLAILFILLFALTGCSKDESTGGNDNEEPQSVYYQPDIDNSFVDTITVEDTIPIMGITTSSGDSISDGDTVTTRVITIRGQVPDFGTMRKSTQAGDTSIFLEADGGSCMNPGPWDDSASFTIGFTQTVSVSHYHYGVMCTGDYGFRVIIKDAAGNIYWYRELDQGIAADVDTTYGSLTLSPGTYTFFVTTVTGTRTYATLTYTPGGAGPVGATVVVYHNGNLYPVAEANPGETFDYSVDLVRGGNTIRVLIIGNFNPAAQQDIANIFGASDPIDIFCSTDEIAIRGVLTWQIDNSDVDLHLVAPDGRVWTDEDCYYGNMNPNWGDSSYTLDDPMLDIDNTYGYGPETIVLPEPKDGLYTFVIHYWGDHGGGDAPTTVVVTLNESTQRTFGPTVLSEGYYWIVTGVRVSEGIAEFASPPDSLSLFNQPALTRKVPKTK
ncbi:hypothetical protein J7K99_02680 [bacterium]|nr:hypothetical protein [bacterium]